MPYFSILSIVYRFFEVIVIGLFLLITTIGYAVAVMVPLIVMEAFVHLMPCNAASIVRYTQRTTGIDEALSENPQH